MVDEEHLELLNAEIDGELSTEQRAELSRYLLSNPAARAVRDDLRRLCGRLDEVELAPVPADLRSSILDSLPRPAEAAVDQARNTGPRSTRAWRYAAVFAGGLLVSALAFEFGLDGRGAPEASDVAGTMASPEFVRASRPVDSVKIELRQVSGQVSLHQAPSKLLLQFDLVARQPVEAPVEVIVTHGGREMHVTGFDRTGGTADQRMAVVLPEAGAGGDSVGLKFVAGGQVLREATLQVPVAH